MTDSDASPAPCPSGGPRSVLRALDALTAIATQPQGITLSDLARTLTVPKSSLLSLMRSLQQGGYVIFSGTGYQLGGSARHLGNLLSGQDRLSALAHPHLTSLVRNFGETAVLAELFDPEHVVFLDQVPGMHPLHVHIGRGELVPIHCSSAGLAILAYQTGNEQNHYMENARRSAWTDRTLVSAADLRACFQTIRQDGYAITEDSMFTGLTAIAAPIFDADGWPAAAIFVTGPTDRMSTSQSALCEELLKRARQISGELMIVPTQARVGAP